MTSALQPPAVLAGGADAVAPDDALCRRYDVALLDLDGVVYRGPDAIPAAPAALASARAAGMRLAFVTNNASRSAEQIVGQLTGLGVAAHDSEVVTSAQAAATLAADRLGPGARVFVVGGEGLRQSLTAAGLVLVDRFDAQPPPQAVVQGFSADLTYEDLAQAALAVAAGADWIATNTDSTLPTARGLQPGNGTLVAAVAAATGRTPVVAGKPERALVDEAVRRVGGSRPLAVGDRLDTDIEGAVRAGLDSLLVLTGVSTIADLLAAPSQQRPTYLGADLSAIVGPGRALTEEGLGDGRWQAVRDGAAVSISLRVVPAAADGETGRQALRASDGPGSADGGSVSEGDAAPGVAQPGRRSDPAEGDGLEVVRALAVAAWQALDAGEAVNRVRVPGELIAPLVTLGVPAALLIPAENAAADDRQAVAAGDRCEEGSDHDE
jgi:HAD superfamily hydrolase (TIGR01457 family)